MDRFDANEIRHMLLVERKTLYDIHDYYLSLNSENGCSLRSLKQFCSDNGIKAADRPSLFDAAEIQQMRFVEKKTMPEILDYYLMHYPNCSGLSLRSLQRFCSSNKITSGRLQAEELDNLVSAAIDRVGPSYGRKMMKGELEVQFDTSAGVRQIGESLKRCKPEYAAFRAKRIKQNLNPGRYFGYKPAYNMHMDQNEKLRFAGVTYVVAIDGYSNYVVAGAVMSIKNPIIIYDLVYKAAVAEYGFFSRVIVDRGQEFALTLFMQQAIGTELKPDRSYGDFFRQLPSRENNRVERFWVEVNRRINDPIRECIFDMNERNANGLILDLSMDHHRFATQFVLLWLCEYAFRITIDNWNQHAIPRVGRPAELMGLLEKVVVPDNLLLSAADAKEFHASSGGHLSDPGSFAVDILKDNHAAKLKRDDLFSHFVTDYILSLRENAFDQRLRSLKFETDERALIFGCTTNRFFLPLQTLIAKHAYFSQTVFMSS